MREILFRAKRKDNGEWIYGDFIRSWHKLNTKPTPMIYNTMGKTEVDPSTVCQFTGLTDKNGNKVFEGDIVRVKGLQNEECWKDYDEIGKVAFIDNAFFIEVPKEYNGMKHYSKIHSYYMTTADWVTREVVGNIFDNKEILQ